MKSENRNNINKSINPFLGFGWSSSFYNSREESILNKIKTDSQNLNHK